MGGAGNQCIFHSRAMCQDIFVTKRTAPNCRKSCAQYRYRKCANPKKNYATMMMTGGVSLAHSVGYLCQGHIVVDSKDFILFQPIERFYSFSTGERRRRDLFTC
jgi:hypothetical protein